MDEINAFRRAYLTTARVTQGSGESARFLGTCFAYRHDGKMFMVTAKHNLVDDDKQGSLHDLFVDGKPHYRLGPVLLHPTLDVAAMPSPDILLPCSPLAMHNSPSLAQEVWALGFPQVRSVDSEPIDFFNIIQGHGISAPLCRRGMVAGGRPFIIMIDGNITPGMSGGPVVTESGIIGVIKGYWLQCKDKDTSVLFSSGLYDVTSMDAVIDLLGGS